MKKTVVVLIAVLLVAATGCQKKEEAAKSSAPKTPAQTAAPQTASPAEPAVALPQVAPQVSPGQITAATPSGGDPHAGFKPREMTPGTGHKGKVLQIVDAGSYTYLEVEEKGKKLWIAALKVKVAKGDMVEFPDSKPTENFHSKTLNKTFDKIIFAENLRIVK